MAKKVAKARADRLLVDRGLADNPNHAMALILKGLVLALDEGAPEGAETKVQSAGQLLLTSVALRIKGARAAPTPRATVAPSAAESATAAATTGGGSAAADSAASATALNNDAGAAAHAAD